jgi:hypothetical protein
MAPTTKRAAQWCGSLALAVIAAVTLAPVSAYAATSSGKDPSDTPVGPEGKTDLRSIAWNVGAHRTNVRIALDASTYGAGIPATLGMHLLVDNDLDGIADVEINAARNADGVSVDMTLRSLSRTLSTQSCQDLAGNAVATATVTPTLINGREKFTFSFANASIAGGLAHFRWAAFGQSPGATATTGPWDYQPNATNADSGAANPGDRRCDSSLTGVQLLMTSGVEVVTATATATDDGEDATMP